MNSSIIAALEKNGNTGNGQPPSHKTALTAQDPPVSKTFLASLAGACLTLATGAFSIASLFLPDFDQDSAKNIYESAAKIADKSSPLCVKTETDTLPGILMKAAAQTPALRDKNATTAQAFETATSGLSVCLSETIPEDQARFDAGTKTLTIRKPGYFGAPRLTALSSAFNILMEHGAERNFTLFCPTDNKDGICPQDITVAFE